MEKIIKVIEVLDDDVNTFTVLGTFLVPFGPWRPGHTTQLRWDFLDCVVTEFDDDGRAIAKHTFGICP